MTFIRLTIGQRCKLVACADSESRYVLCSPHCIKKNKQKKGVCYQHLKIRNTHIHTHTGAFPENPEKLSTLGPLSLMATKTKSEQWLDFVDGTHTLRVSLLGRSLISIILKAPGGICFDSSSCGQGCGFGACPGSCHGRHPLCHCVHLEHRECILSRDSVA